MKEQEYDQLLRIQTEKHQMGYHKSLHYHRYEPTPYAYLDYFFNRYKLYSTDRVVDFGCGKGRLNFYIHYLFQSTVIGIEMNEKFYHDALSNLDMFEKKNKNSKNKIYFYNQKAEDYFIHPADNKFYFFNPFSLPIFRKIIDNILLSVEENKREVELILYYASEDYQYFLDNHDAFIKREEFKLPSKDNLEIFLVYRTI